MQKKVGIIVQARAGSTRLPNKVMKDILGKPMLFFLIERLKKVPLADVIIIAAPTGEENQPIIETAKSLHVETFRGSEADVLSRYFEAAKAFHLDVIVRITSDCPLIDPGIVNSITQSYLGQPSFDYLSNTVKRTFPRGMDTEVFSFAILKVAHELATAPYQREHVTPYILEKGRVSSFEQEQDWSKIRLTIDTIEDFNLVNEIFMALYKPGQMFSLSDIISLLKRQPELIEINRHVERRF
jgi:spore coat polysaccharide biosynthesis protein SpsF